MQRKGRLPSTFMTDARRETTCSRGIAQLSEGRWARINRRCDALFLSARRSRFFGPDQLSRVTPPPVTMKRSTKAKLPRRRPRTRRARSSSTPREEEHTKTTRHYCETHHE